MFCKNCGKEIDDNAAVCIHCGVAVNGNNSGNLSGQPSYHPVPKCKKCGYVGEFDTEPLLRPIDWVIGLATMLLAGLGILYFIIILIIRHDANNRKICPHCKSKNTMTDMY